MPAPSPPATPTPAVLVVEDDPTNRYIALSMLRHLGVEADAAADGPEGVAKASAQAYDVVLMDVRMPGMDGEEAMRRIRSGGGPSAAARMVAVSAHGVDGVPDRLLEAGFDTFVHKPLSVHVLEDALAPDTDPVVEAVREHVRGLLGEDDRAFVADLAGSFVDSARAAARSAADARDGADADGVARAAHALKGSASNVGLEGLAEAWAAVEAGALRGDATALDGHLDRALEETEDTIGRLAKARA